MSSSLPADVGAEARVRGHSRAREAGASSGHEERHAQVDEREADQGAQEEAADEPRFGFGHEVVRDGRSCRSGCRSGQCALICTGLTITAPPRRLLSVEVERLGRGGSESKTSQSHSRKLWEPFGELKKKIPPRLDGSYWCHGITVILISRNRI